MMQPAIDRTSLERLTALGRQKGRLTNQDLEEGLPVDRMSAEDIALVVAHLEEAGIPVDLDDALLDPHGMSRPPNMEGAQIVPFPERSAIPPVLPVKAEPLREAARVADPPSASETGNIRPVHWAVLAALLILLLIGFALFALPR
jgi:Sigma-70 factor, region 1.1